MASAIGPAGLVLAGPLSMSGHPRNNNYFSSSTLVSNINEIRDSRLTCRLDGEC